MTTVVFNWSPLIENGRDKFQDPLPQHADMPTVPRQGDYLDFEDEQVGVVKHVTWDILTGYAYLYVDVIS